MRRNYDLIIEKVMFYELLWFTLIILLLVLLYCFAEATPIDAEFFRLLLGMLTEWFHR